MISVGKFYNKILKLAILDNIKFLASTIGLGISPDFKIPGDSEICPRGIPGDSKNTLLYSLNSIIFGFFIKFSLQLSIFSV